MLSCKCANKAKINDMLIIFQLIDSLLTYIAKAVKHLTADSLGLAKEHNNNRQ